SVEDIEDSKDISEDDKDYADNEKKNDDEKENDSEDISSENLNISVLEMERDLLPKVIATFDEMITSTDEALILRKNSKHSSNKLEIYTIKYGL
ncbi:MAG: RNA polymerase sigma factor RpoD, partial [Wolbachia sp.]